MCAHASPHQQGADAFLMQELQQVLHICQTALRTRHPQVRKKSPSLDHSTC